METNFLFYSFILLKTVTELPLLFPKFNALERAQREKKKLSRRNSQVSGNKKHNSIFLYAKTRSEKFDQALPWTCNRKQTASFMSNHHLLHLLTLPRSSSQPLSAHVAWLRQPCLGLLCKVMCGLV